MPDGDSSATIRAHSPHPSSDSVDALLTALLTHPRAADWHALLQLAQTEHGPRPYRFLAARLNHSLAALPAERREAILLPLAALIAPNHANLVAALAAIASASSRTLALACLPHLAPPFDRRVLRDLVNDGTLPTKARLKALAHVLPHLEERRATRLLAPLFTGLRRSKGIALLRNLERRTGPLPIYAALRERLDDRVRMNCPRCATQLRRREMQGHLWEQHRLVLEGHRVREAWAVVEDWLANDRKSPRAELIARCTVAAEKIDPQKGKGRLARLLLTHRLADLDTLQHHLQAARQQHAGCCPACYAFVPLPSEAPLPAVTLVNDHLLAGGYRVEISELGLRPRLEIVTPDALLFEGREPERPWTPAGGAFVYTSLFVLSAILWALLWPIALGSPIRPVVALLAGALVTYYVTRWALRRGTSLAQRVLDHTWHRLVPELHAGKFNLHDSAFAAALADWHTQHGRFDVPEDLLTELIRRTELAMTIRQVPTSHLAALLRLQIELAVQEGQDPVPLVVRHLTRCFQGTLPLSFAQHLLENWAADWWNRVNLTRLRILICDRAFEAGYEVQSLLDAGQNAPALGTVLGVDAPRALAALRLVWSWRATRPWDRLGEVTTVFDLAADPERAQVFRERPDLLLHQEDRTVQVVAEGFDEFAPARIQVTLAGVCLQEILFNVPPRVFEVRRRTMGTELILGKRVFRSMSDLDPLSRRVEKWFRWVFHELLPQVDRVLTWQSPHRAALLRAWGAVPCPECAQPLLARVGQVGISLEEKKEGER